MSETQESVSSWTCSCGQENEGKFCIACGKSRPQPVETVALVSEEEDGNSWVCSCGQRNEGKFCIVCGKPKEPMPIETTEAAEQAKHLPEPAGTETQVTTPSGTPIKKSFHIKPKTAAALGIVAVLAIGIVGGTLAKFYFGVEETSTNIAFTGKTIDKGSMSSTAVWLSAESDLSLEGVELGDKLDKIHELLGTEINSVRKAGGQNYTFADLDVLLKNGTVAELVSKTEDARTKRGIHQGSVEDEVLQVYGQGYQKITLGSDTAYDYTLKMSDERNGILRFVISNGKVKLIRVWANVPVGTSTAGNTPSNAAMKVMQNYHQAISNRQYKQAYDMLTNRQKNQMGVYDNYAKGFADTIYSNVSQLKVTSAGANRVVLTYNLTAKDRADGGRVKVQTFAGTATLVLQGNVWLIDEMSAKQTGTRTE